MLNLYKSITPNVSGTHYYFKDFSKYVSKLASNLFKTIDETRYDINKGFIRVKLGTDLTEANYKMVTYIINTTDNICYHVTNEVVQSGYVYYGVNVDFWASYIAEAQINNINVRKCNRKLSNNGIYDAIKTTNKYEIKRLDDRQYSHDDLMIILFITIEWKSQVTGALGKTQERIATSLSNFTHAQDIGNLIEIVGRYKYYGSLDTTKFENTIEITNMFLIPNNCVTLGEQVRLARGETQETSDIVYKIDEDIKRIDFTLPFSSNEKIFVGGSRGNIEVIRNVTKNASVSYIFSYGLETLKVIITDGDNQQEISEGFKLPVSVRDKSASATSELTTVLSYFLGASKIGIGLFSGSPLSIVSGIGSIGRQIARDVNQPQQHSNIVGTGDGVTAYGYKLPYKSAFLYFLATSIIDEDTQLRKVGANFNEYIIELETIFSKELLGSGSANDDTYVIASMDVNNIPTSAIDVIEGRFNNGVYLQILL